MGEEAKINFYRVNKCGYYHTKTGDHLNCSLESTLEQINHWAFKKGRQLNQTCTYQVTSSDSGVLETYCFDISKNNNEFLLVTWNKTETLDDAFASVKGTDLAGHAHVKTANYPHDHIPGYPTFFWFIPSKKLFATIKFNNQRLNGHKGLKLLFGNFLKTYSNYVCRSKFKGGGIKVDGYFKDIITRKLHNNAKPEFETSVERKKGELDFIVKNYQCINKIYRKSTLHSNERNSVELWKRALDNLGMIETKKFVDSVNFRTEFPLQPSKQDVKAIIKKWEKNRETSFDNVGFDIKGVKETKWLSHTLVKTSIELDVERNENSVISASSLLKSLKEEQELAMIIDSFQNE